MKTRLQKLFSWVRTAAMLYGLGFAIYLGATMGGARTAGEFAAAPQAIPGGLWFLHVSGAMIVWELAAVIGDKLAGVKHRIDELWTACAVGLVLTAAWVWLVTR